MTLSTLDQVEAQAKLENQFFEAMLNLIPSDVYFNAEKPLSKFAHKKSGSAPVAHKMKKRTNKEKLEATKPVVEVQNEKAEQNEDMKQGEEDVCIEDLRSKLKNRISSFRTDRTRDESKPEKRIRKKKKKAGVSDLLKEKEEKEETVAMDISGDGDGDGSKKEENDSKVDVMFGNIVLDDEADPEKLRKKKQKQAALQLAKKSKKGKIERLEASLAKAEKQKAKLASMNAEEIEAHNEKMMVLKAKGVKVVDDAKLIKQSIKRVKAKKSKNQAKWAKRAADKDARREAEGERIGRMVDGDDE